LALSSIPEAAARYEALETIRAAYFDVMFNPNPPPCWLVLDRELMDGHLGDFEWVKDTYRRWLDDPWAQSRRPPGSLAMLGYFDGASESKHWRRHQGKRPRPPQKVTVSGSGARLLEKAMLWMKNEGLAYLASAFGKMISFARLDGDELVIAVPSEHEVGWIQREIGPILDEALIAVGHTGNKVIAPSKMRLEVAS
jgi:hypothetical protein